jgi:hypothetical protein
VILRQLQSQACPYISFSKLDNTSTVRPLLPFSPVLLEATVEQLKAQLSEALQR